MKYEVTIRRSIYQSAKVEISAKTEDEAAIMAEHEANISINGGKSKYKFEWELEDDTIEIESVDDL